MSIQQIIWTAAVAFLLVVESLNQHNECRATRAAGGSWEVTDSKGCGFNHGVDPLYVTDKWIDCVQRQGYEYSDPECTMWQIEPDEDEDEGSDEDDDVEEFSNED